MKLAILYAGQGSQHPGMGKDLYEAYPAFRAAFDAAALDFDLHSVCFEDPDGVLNQTEYTQPCMVAFAAGVTAVLQENGVKADDLAGLSLVSIAPCRPPVSLRPSRRWNWRLTAARQWPMPPKASTAA